MHGTGFRPAVSAADADIDFPRLASQRPPMVSSLFIIRFYSLTFAKADVESRQLEPEHLTAYLGELTSLCMYTIVPSFFRIFRYSVCSDKFIVAFIIGDILEELYSGKGTGSEDTHRNDFQVRLLEWREKLREDLRCDIFPGNPTPSAQVLMMHLSYWSAVILNNRSLSVNF